MTVLFVIVPVALLLVGGAIAAYAWSTRRGQFDDLVTPALRMLHDDPPARGVRDVAPAPGVPASAELELSSEPPSIV